MFVYARAAIDFWPGWMTEKDFRANLANVYNVQGGSAEWTKYGTFRAKAYELAKKAGWEGDIREGPYVAGLPTHETADDGHFMIAWKQDNNGDTFVASPYRLPWLESGDYGKWVQG
jgi:hypothetical protein